MIKNIISVANSLDRKGLTKEADILDNLLAKMAQMAEEAEKDLELEEDSESGDLVSAITTIIDQLSSQPQTEDTSQKIEMLSSLLEDSL